VLISEKGKLEHYGKKRYINRRRKQCTPEELEGWGREKGNLNRKTKRVPKQS